MKKNILTIIIMAIVLINTALLAVLIFAIVPAAKRTNQLIDKVASVVDLELESKSELGDVTVKDIVSHNIDEKLTVNLASTDDEAHYAQMQVSLSMNSKNEDYKDLSEKMLENENAIKEIITDIFAKYTIEQVKENKDKIREEAKKQIQDYFSSDFIISISFGNMLFQ